MAGEGAGHSPDAVIAVDVGGTGIKAALCRPDGQPLAQRRRPTPVADGVPAVLAAIAELIEELAATARDGSAAQVRGVGLILPGAVDAAAGLASYSTNLGWRDLPIRDLINDRVGLPVAIEHDVRAGGLAELSLGAARDAGDALFLAIGTGIAGAMIIDGRLVTGTGNLAGEIGHLPAVPNGELCACGQRGCTETYASAAALPRRYRALSATTGAGPATDLVAAEQVLARAAAGDPLAVQVYDQALAALSQALVCYTMLLDPAVIVLGGGLSLAGDQLRLPLAAQMAAAMTWRVVPKLVPAHFGADSGRVGAALIGWQAYRERHPAATSAADNLG